MPAPTLTRRNLTRRIVLAGALAAPAFAAPALARTRDAHAAPLPRLAVLTTMSGPAADGAGPGSVLAARLAIQDAGIPAALVVADMGSRPETGAALVREWLDRDGVHAILDVPNSATALAVATLVRERDAIALFSGPGTTELTRGACSPNHLQWTYDTAALAAGCARAVQSRYALGTDPAANTWFFLTADYAFGHSLQDEVSAVVQAAGGRVLGAARFPGETTDFAPLLLQAQASGARFWVLACAGGPFETLVKQAAEFGPSRPQHTVVCPLCLVTNVHAIGLPDAQGTLVAAPFYWDLDARTRAFAARFAPANRGIPPTMVHAGVYAATRHLLAAIRAGADPARGAATIAAMKRLPAEDGLFTETILRPDGGVSHAMHLFQVKSPARSTGPWDVYEKLVSIPAAEAFGPGGACLAPA